LRARALEARAGCAVLPRVQGRGEQAEAVGLVEETARDLDQMAVAGQLDQEGVEAVVGLGPGVAVVGLEGRVHIGDGALKAAQLLGRQPARGELLGGAGFEVGEHLADLADVAYRDRFHPHPLARDDLDQTLLFKANQHLAHGRAADAELARQLLLQRLKTGRQLHPDDLGAERGVDLVDDARAPPGSAPVVVRLRDVLVHGLYASMERREESSAPEIGEQWMRNRLSADTSAAMVLVAPRRCADPPRHGPRKPRRRRERAATAREASGST
jgi:hypothetical protein